MKVARERYSSGVGVGIGGPNVAGANALSGAGGKGNYWTLADDADDMFEPGNFRRRKRRPKTRLPLQQHASGGKYVSTASICHSHSHSHANSNAVNAAAADCAAQWSCSIAPSAHIMSEQSAAGPLAALEASAGAEGATEVRVQCAC